VILLGVPVLGKIGNASPRDARGRPSAPAIEFPTA
jgi:hypothetical protein